MPNSVWRNSCSYCVLLRYYGKEDIRIDIDVPEPKCGPGQVKVRARLQNVHGVFPSSALYLTPTTLSRPPTRHHRLTL